MENASAQRLHTEGMTLPEAFPVKAGDDTFEWQRTMVSEALRLGPKIGS
jgi:hypothetical protein